MADVTDFAKQLEVIDPGFMSNLELMDLLQGTVETDNDAKNIVRKSGYLLKIANARPGHVSNTS